MKSTFNMTVLNHMKALFIVVMVLLFINMMMIKALMLEPCQDMTKTAPACKYDIRQTIDATISKYDIPSDASLINVISDDKENHYMALNFPSFLSIGIKGYVRSTNSFTSLFNVVIKDTCGGASVDGKSLFAIDSDMIVLLGNFYATAPICVGDFQITNITSLVPKSVPFVAILSKTSGKVLSVGPYDSSRIGYSFEAIALYRYMLISILRSGSQLNYFVNGIVKHIATCQDPSKLNINIHFSDVYKKVIVTFFESASNQLVINGDSKSYSTHQSALWVLVLDYSDGSYVHSQRIFHSTTSVMQPPKIKFDSNGKLNIILSCNDGCFLNGDSVSANMFLLQYDYIKTIYTYSKNFISTSPYHDENFKAHSLSIERDNTLTCVITGYGNSYSIVDGYGRSIAAQSNAVYQYRFRYTDGKIIHVKMLTTDSATTDSFIVSTSNQYINSNHFITEQNPIIYMRTSGNIKELKVLSFLYYGNRYTNEFVTDPTHSQSYGGNGGSGDGTTTKKITSIVVMHSADYVYGFVINYFDGTDSIFGSYGKYTTELVLDNDEYIARITHSYGSYSVFTVIACISFQTNKKTISVNNCYNRAQYVETVPSNLEIVGFSTKSGVVIDSIVYYYGYSKTFSCGNGYSGDSCNVPVCYGIEASNPAVCNANGVCTAPDTCKCYTNLASSSNCLNYVFCNDISKYSPNVCNGRGKCQFDHNCTCDVGYYGQYCEIEAKCYGISKNSYGVCSNHGTCLDTDKCVCNTGYTGNNCEIPICNGLLLNDSRVCSGHGACVKGGVCICKPGYSNLDCQSFGCYGFDSLNPKVCSSKGYCVDYNNCNCLEGYYGDNCENFTCNGIHFKDANVCNGNGQCIKPDTCSCTRPKSFGNYCQNCEKGYYGSHCELWTCGGIENTSPLVCSGRGSCSSYDKCQCNSATIIGTNCETCITGYYGEKCGNWTCDSVSNNDESVCNYRGQCSSYNVCKCNMRSTGQFCNQCLDYYTGKTCSSCLGDHYGEDCYNFLTSDRAVYAKSYPPLSPYASNSLLIEKYVNKMTIEANSHNNLASTPVISCSKLFGNMQELFTEDHSNVLCLVELKGTYDGKTYVYSIEVYSKFSETLYNPRVPIMFNVMWATSNAPKYVTMKLDVSFFVNSYQQKFHVDVSIMNNGMNNVNRCFETIFKEQIEYFDYGKYYSLSWELVGKSSTLMENELVRQALQNAQNTSTWTLPYTLELSKLDSIQMNVSVVSNFGLTASAIFKFPVGLPYPKSMLQATKYIKMTSPEAIVPMAIFVPENPECVDLRTMYFSSTLNGSPTFIVSSYDTYIKIKPTAFSERFYELKLIFLSKYEITLILGMIPPIVSIKESVIMYKPSITPSITLSCKSYYGNVDASYLPFVFLISENNQLTRKVVSTMNSTAVIQVPVNQLNQFSYTLPDHTFTVSCLISQYYASSSIYELSNTINYLNAGVANKKVSFISESSVSVSSCKVLAAVLTGTLVNNLIPSMSEPMTYYLEIYTTSAAYCLVSVNLINSNSSTILDSVLVNGPKYVLPIQYYNGKLISNQKTALISGNQFTISLIGTNDVADVRVPITIQQSLAQSVYISECEISPSLLQVGFTIAQLNCKMKSSMTFSMNSLSLNLLQDGISVGTTSYFPIIFKVYKAGFNFNIMLDDMQTGGKLTIPINITNNVKFTTNQLFSNDAVSLISNQVNLTTADFYKNNDVILSLVSNIDGASVSDSVKIQVAKIVPIALTKTTSSISDQMESSLAQSSLTSDDMTNFISQVKVLSNPQFLTEESTLKTVDILSKFIDTSSKADIWGSGSSSSLSSILVNIASKIPEESTMKLANSIANAAISLGGKSELSLVDFFPSEKLPNLVSINAVKTPITSLASNLFSFWNSNTSLLSMSTSSETNNLIISIVNTLFKYPSSTVRSLKGTTNKEYISQLTISESLSGKVHVNIPIPSCNYPPSSSIKQTFQCSVTLDFETFQTETICKSFKTLFESLPDVKPDAKTVLVDCSCNLSLLSKLMKNNSMIGITADYFEETIPTASGDNGGGGKFVETIMSNPNLSIAAVAVIAIPILIICCVVLIAIPIIIVWRRKKENAKRNQAPKPPTTYDSSINSPTFENSTNIDMNIFGNFTDIAGMPVRTANQNNSIPTTI